LTAALLRANRRTFASLRRHRNYRLFFSGQVISVTLKSIPPKARFFHFGKEIGTAPFVLELKPGEKHAYEAGLPGYITRKVLVDGTKPEITVGLRKE